MGKHNGRARKRDIPTPKDLVAERNLIGSIFFAPKMLSEVVKIVADRDFFDTELKAVYATMAKRHARGEAIDHSLIAADLATDIEDAYAKLSAIAVAVPNASNSKDYARIVADMSTRRQLLDNADHIFDGIRDGTATTDLIETIAYDVWELKRGHCGGSRADGKSLIGVEPMNTEWTWERWIPSGAMTVLDGDPGLGKSQITIDLAARISNGWPFPPHVGVDAVYTPSNVVLMSAEDDLRRTIRKRAEVAGADLSRVHAITSMDGGQRPPELPGDIDAIKDYVRQHDAGLLIIDPLSAYISADIDTHKDSDVRRCLHRIAMMAEETDAAVLLVRHMTKDGSKRAKYRGGGSIGIIGAARSGLLVAEDPDDDECCVLASSKSNLGPPPVSLRYRIRAVGDTSNVEWLGETAMTADEVVGGTRQPGRPSKVEQCAELLERILADGPMDSVQATYRCEIDGYSDRTIKRARRKANVTATKTGFASGWQWFIEGSQ